MAQFSGTLNLNAIQSALFNMIISQSVLAGSIKSNYNLVNKAKEDVGLYGDQKLFIDSPTIDPIDWEQDSEEAINLLKLHRPKAPKTQALTINVFKQVALTKDEYLSKQAFGTPGAFSRYISVIESRLNKSKEVYLDTTYNAFIGTVAGVANDVEVDLAADGNTAGENIAYELANLIDDMKDYNTKYTANGFLRAFGDDEIKIVWNKKYINQVKKLELPEIFHNEILEKSFVGDKLPSRYFGTINTTAATGDGATIRAVKDMYVTVDSASVYVKAGDLIPVGVEVAKDLTYTEDDEIICKVFTKLPPILEAFSVGTSFYNSRNLSTNMYLTFGHSTLEALDSEAIVTVRVKPETQEVVEGD